MSAPTINLFYCSIFIFILAIVLMIAAIVLMVKGKKEDKKKLQIYRTHMLDSECDMLHSCSFGSGVVYFVVNSLALLKD